MEYVQGPVPWFGSEMAREAVKKMKDGKASGKSGTVAEMLKASGEFGIEMVTYLVNGIIREMIPNDWEENVIIKCYIR